MTTGDEHNPADNLADDRPPLELRVSEERAGQRLDRFLKDALPGISGGSIRRLLEANQVLIDGKPGRKGSRLGVQQRVLVAVGAATERPVPQPDLALTVLRQTPALVAMNKTPGIPSHPLLPGERDTMANALLARYPECGAASERAREGGLVHRLDWCTSGVLLAARSRSVYRRLRGMFAAGEVDKRYVALVAGTLEEPQVVSLPLRTRARDRQRVSIAARLDEGQPARSEVEPIAHLGDLSLVAVRCHTGRRHQVRVHLAALGHPIVNDELYGGPEVGDEGCGAFLHAASVSFAGECFTAPLPAQRRELLISLGYPFDRVEALPLHEADQQGAP